MKRIIKYAMAVGIVSFAFNSCDMNLLPSDGIAYQEGERLFLNKTDIDSYENGILASYRAVQGGVFAITSEVMGAAFNATIDFGNNYGPAHRSDKTFGASDYDAEAMWQNHYAAIKNYNVVIGAADNVDEELKAAAQFIKAEAYYFRASSYLTLVRHYGKAYDASTAATDLAVPLITKYDQTEKPARATVKAIYDQIKEDLDASAPILNEVAGTVRAQKPTVDALNALYARYYLDTKEYGKAAQYADLVINSAAGYALAATVEDLGNVYYHQDDNVGTEAILQLYASAAEGAIGNSAYTGWGKNTDEEYVYKPYFLPSKYLIDSYQESDIRRDAWFDNTKYVFMAGTNYENLHVFIKYKGVPSFTTANHGVSESTSAKPMLISEMYLIAAEAYAMGNNPLAKDRLNSLQRARKASATDGDMANIKKEWFKETIGEGLYFSCVKRWGDGFPARPAQDEDAVMSGVGYLTRTLDATDHHFCWPVPTYEMQVNKNLVQNPGYSAN